MTRKTIIKKKKRGSIKISIHAENCEKLFCLQSHHQGGSLPAHSTSGYQQSNYPSGTTALSAGFQLNFLVEALSTISRHDDYKCVARILCEMASGKLPGRSLGKRGSGLLEFLGRTVFTEYVFLARLPSIEFFREIDPSTMFLSLLFSFFFSWLAKIDVGGTSPLLIFGRAMILGYSNRGSSEPCYQAFPKCPRDMNGLVHYLNNYNGGFFRLFNRIRGGKYRESSGIVDQRGEKWKIDNRVSPSLEMRFNLFFHIYCTVEDYSKMDVKGRIVGGNSRKYIPIQSASEPVIRNTVQLPVMSYQEYLKKKGIPGYDNMSSEVIFPNERDPSPSVEEPSNSVENDGAKSEWKVWRKDKIAFFPEVILYFHGKKRKSVHDIQDINCTYFREIATEDYPGSDSPPIFHSHRRNSAY